MSPQEVMDVLYYFIQEYITYCNTSKTKPYVSSNIILNTHPIPDTIKPYLNLFHEAYAYLHNVNTNMTSADKERTIESIVSNVIVEVTLRKAAAESGITIQELKALPLKQRRSYHDDTTVVAMFI